MPRYKIPDVDIDALEDAEYSEGDGDFEEYGGEIPPAKITLNGWVKKMWLTETQKEDPMLKVLTVADGNDGTKYEEFEGCPFWENLALTAGAKFKWQPFLDNFGLKLRDVVGPKSKLYVAEDDDNIGTPIEKIAGFEPGTESAACRIVTAREKYQGEWQARIGAWLPPAEDEEEDEELEENEVNPPVQYQDEPEEEDEAAPPPRTRAARGSRTPAKSRAATATSAPRGKRRAKTSSDDDPPF